MPFVLDRISGLLGAAQYNTYEENRLYLNDLHRDPAIKDITNYQLIEVRRAIAKNSTQVQATINNTITNVCGSLELGFNEIANQLDNTNQTLEEIAQGIDDLNWQLADVNSGLDELNDNVSELRALFDLKTDLIIEQQTISNSYLSAIATGVHLPEKKKLNNYHNKKGEIFLNTAIAEGPKSNFYDKALVEFKEAYKNDDADYVCLHHLGFVYAKAQHFRNVEKALYFFKESALNAIAFYNYNGNTQVEKVVATSFYYASFCSYILNRPSDALIQIKNALKIRPNDAKYLFLLAKFLAAYDQEYEAAEILLKLIERNKYFSIEILKDQDMISKTAIQEMLNRETRRLVYMAEEEIKRIKALLTNFYDRDVAISIKKIEQEFNPKTYVTARIAKEKLRI